MRRSNYDLSTALVAVGAVAVLISLFLDWYEPGQSAFDAFEITDWLLVALAVGALVVIATESWAGGGVPSNRLAWICGLLAFVVVAQLLDPPPAARGEAREVGAWLALGGSVLMVAGAVLAMAQISVTIDVTERERRRRMAAVDARDDDGGEAATTASRSASSGLWQAPSAPGAAEADDERESARDARASDAREPKATSAKEPRAPHAKEPNATEAEESSAPQIREQTATAGQGRRARGAEEPSAPGATEPRATGAEEREASAAAEPRARAAKASRATAAPGDDPDRTQPLKPVDRPAGDDDAS